MLPDSMKNYKVMEIKYYKILVAILSIIGAISILVLTNRYGVVTTPDSVAYVSVARHIADGSGFVGYDGYNYVLQAPLYPLILAGIKLIFSIDSLISAGYFNAVIFGLIIFYAGTFLLKNLKSFTLAFLGVASIMISVTIIQISLAVLSELLFVLLVLIYLYHFEVYRGTKSIMSLIIFSSAASLACLTRYVGIIIIITGAISIFLLGSKT